MKIGFSIDYSGSGGAKTWIRNFSNYCIENGHNVSYGFDESVDVFCSISDISREEDLIKFKKNNIKILQRYGAIYLPYDSTNTKLLNKRNLMLTTRAKYADSIVYQSKFSKEVLFRSIFNGSEPDGEIIYNSAPSNIFRPEGSTIKRDSSKKLILAASYWGTVYAATKSVEILTNILEHFKSRNDIEFWILGYAYSENEALLKKLDYKNVTRVDLSAPIPYNSIPNYLRTADMLLHLKANEGCSNMVIEAMFSGVPLVGINSGSLPELVGNSALLANCNNTLKEFPSIDIVDLVNKIDKTLQNPEYYSAKMLENSQNFSADKTYKLYLDKLIYLYDAK